MGQMQRMKRLRREIAGRARIKVLPAIGRNLARAIGRVGEALQGIDKSKSEQ